jgi:LmbE family N-acetylglucosaminyl deacetylase
MTLPSLLAVFAHPDDESLSAGGLLARHAVHRPAGPQQDVAQRTGGSRRCRRANGPH